MNAKAEAGSGVLDKLKWVVVLALAGGGVFANWFYQDQPLLYRVIGLLVLALVAAFLALQTERGKATWTLLREARGEIRRVVWPTRNETAQTTVIVLILVVVFAFILWALDSLLGWLVKSIIG